MEVEIRRKINLIRTFDRQVPRKPRHVGGVKGHNQKRYLFARFRLATSCPGKPPGLYRGELHKNERWITSCEGMKRYGISLGSVENGVYFRKEKEGMCLLQKA